MKSKRNSVFKQHSLASLVPLVPFFLCRLRTTERAKTDDGKDPEMELQNANAPTGFRLHPSALQRTKSSQTTTMTTQHRRQVAAPTSAAAHRRLLTAILFLIVLTSTTTNLHVAASSSTSNDTDADCNTNDKNAAEEEQVCASRIVPPSNGDADSSESNTIASDGACEDMHADCAERAERGECGGKSAGFMLDECRLSCHVCGDYEEPPVKNQKGCYNKNGNCKSWTKRNQCETNTRFMLENCPVSCGACATSIQKDTDFGVEQQVPEDDPTAAAKVDVIVRETKKYMRKVRANPEYGTIRETCRNGNAMCSIWAAAGECQTNPAAMLVTCAPACQSCEMVDAEKRCPMENINEENVLKEAGDLNALFERIVDDEADELGFSKLKPRTVQRPYKSGETRTRTWNIGPWMVAFDQFLSDEEADRLIEIASNKGFGRSEEVTKKVKPDGSFERRISTYRTSSNTWCDSACQEDAIVQPIIDRIANVTGIPESHSEPLQILKYQDGEKYGEHADYIRYQKDRPCGPRILTLLIYLSDDFNGGGTKFRFLRDYTVKPKKGMAILWPNVLNKDPMEEDELFDHEALPVTGGVKYAANAWVHMRNFKDNSERQCI